MRPYFSTLGRYRLRLAACHLCEFAQFIRQPSVARPCLGIARQKAKQFRLVALLFQ